MSEEKYYIGGKQYVPAKSAILCKVTEIFDEATLYRTKKGAFFRVTKSCTDNTKVEVMTAAAAHAWMDEHAAEIDTGIYDRVFGKPERG